MESVVKLDDEPLPAETAAVAERLDDSQGGSVVVTLNFESASVPPATHAAENQLSDSVVETEDEPVPPLDSANMAHPPNETDASSTVNAPTPAAVADSPPVVTVAVGEGPSDSVAVNHPAAADPPVELGHSADDDPKPAVIVGRPPTPDGSLSEHSAVADPPPDSVTEPSVVATLISESASVPAALHAAENQLLDSVVEPEDEPVPLDSANVAHPPDDTDASSTVNAPTPAAVADSPPVVTVAAGEGPSDSTAVNPAAADPLVPTKPDIVSDEAPNGSVSETVPCVVVDEPSPDSVTEPPAGIALESEGPAEHADDQPTVVVRGKLESPAVAHLKMEGRSMETSPVLRRGGKLLRELRRPSQIPMSMGPTQESDSNPLCVSASKGYLKLARTLLEKNADANQLSSDQTPVLFLAAQGGFADMVRLLLDHGADQDGLRKDGASALHAAANGGHEDVVKILLSRGASIDLRDEQGATPLYASVAARKESTAIVKRFLDAGAAVNAADSHGSTVLYVAGWNGHAKVVKLLLQRGAEPDQADDGMTALYISSWTGHADIVKLLLKAGADPNVLAIGGLLPLHVAAQEGHDHVIQHLLDAGTDIDAVDDAGNTALHFASVDGHVAAVECLLNNHASLTKVNKDDQTPYMMAKRKTIKKILRTHSTSGDGLKKSRSQASLKRRSSKKLSRSKTVRDVRQKKKRSLGSIPVDEAILAQAVDKTVKSQGQNQPHNASEDAASTPIRGDSHEAVTMTPVAPTGVPLLHIANPGVKTTPSGPQRPEEENPGCCGGFWTRLLGRRGGRASSIAPAPLSVTPGHVASEASSSTPS